VVLLCFVVILERNNFKETLIYKTKLTLLDTSELHTVKFVAVIKCIVLSSSSKIYQN